MIDLDLASMAIEAGIGLKTISNALGLI